MPTVRVLIFSLLSTLAISAQLAARHPNAGLSEGYLNNHDLYARAEPRLFKFDVRDLVFHSPVIRSMIQGADNVNNEAQPFQSNRRRDAGPDSESNTLNARDPFLGGLIRGVIKGIQGAVKSRKGAKKGVQGAKKGVQGAKQGVQGAKQGIDAAQPSQPKQRRDAEPYSMADTLDARDPFLGGLIRGVIKGIQGAVKGRKGAKKGVQGAKKGVQGAKQGNDAAQQSQPKQKHRREREVEARGIH
ncbi:hypothetical protein MMC27_006720 [Xylographa pallens]|nr:hypothetical protein [Xylographa pallens]